MTRSRLHARRVDAVRAWTSFVERGDVAGRRGAARDPLQLEPVRGGRDRRPQRGAAGRRGRDRGVLADSPLQTAVERVEAELRRTAEDGDLVVAVTDPRPGSCGRTAAG